ncbi:phage portal protein [Hyphobacterium marinum]|uniref:Phage portal protein n=1 Tax=Hyphobacterium marinum TaxID=3116574 RepID=A0ABU7M0N8_9PROT|nr:phage portal protein [Hyphobacterium sp. Y6023]MEE2567335.1 phage portal protein [Hyphobacterium sp. Y6023]
MFDGMKLALGRETKTSAAKPLIALTFGGRAAWTPRDYGALAREGFSKNPIAHRCVRLIAEAGASVPLTVRRAGVERDNDPAARLLAEPNPDQSGAEFLETHFGFLQVAGNAYAELAAIDGVPRELYALRPDRMKVLPGTRGWPDGWEYSTGGRSVRFVRDKANGRSPILHMRLFHPGDDHYGFSPLEAAAMAVDVHNAGGAWAKALLDNAARPSGALVVTAKEGEGRLTDDQYERLKEELSELHTGPSNAGRPLLLEGGLDWKPMALTPADMDFIAARREAAREIALAYGVPPLLLGLPGDNTYANYKEANLAFWRQTVLPLARKSAAAMTGWLRPWFGDDLDIVCDEDGLPALAEERASRWARITMADFLSDAEKRALLGLSDGAA